MPNGREAISSYFCRGSIRDGPMTKMGSYENRAQTISFVERGFERLGLDHRTVAWLGPVNEYHLRSFGSSRSDYFSSLKNTMVGRTDCPPPLLDCLFFLLY